MKRRFGKGLVSRVTGNLGTGTHLSEYRVRTWRVDAGGPSPTTAPCRARSRTAYRCILGGCIQGEKPFLAAQLECVRHPRCLLRRLSKVSNRCRPEKVESLSTHHVRCSGQKQQQELRLTPLVGETSR